MVYRRNLRSRRSSSNRSVYVGNLIGGAPAYARSQARRSNAALAIQAYLRAVRGRMGNRRRRNRRMVNSRRYRRYYQSGMTRYY